MRGGNEEEKRGRKGEGGKKRVCILEAAARTCDEGIEEVDVGLVASEYFDVGHVLCPLLDACGVVFDVVEVDIWEEFEPGVVGFSGAVGHVAA
jgi:hypothetical protein